MTDPGFTRHCPLSTPSLSTPLNNAPILSPASPLSSSFLNISTPVQVDLDVSLIPIISISSPTLITPRSTLPVTTVPRPEIEKTSSIGIRKGKNRDEYVIASEDALFSSLGFTKLRDIEPGEAVFIDKNGELFSQQCSDSPQKRPCIFEYVYFSRPDSKIDEISVYKARMRMGSKLADQIKKIKPDHDIDVVIPIPDSSTIAAHELAVDLGVPYREGFVKNRYIGRTFIMPYQEERKKSVRRKLNILDLEFKGKNVLLVDDSIVRGTTSKKIIEMARDAGANKVYFASAAPAIKYQNLYGIDMPATSELIASNRSDEEVAKEINADWLIYQTLEDLIETAADGNPEIKEFESSIFTGKYITPLIENYLEELENSRKDELKIQREKSKASG